jgi:hypothetical protein
MTLSISFFQGLVLFGLLLIFAALLECRRALKEIIDKLADTNEHLEALETSVSSIDDKVEQGEADPGRVP